MNYHNFFYCEIFFIFFVLYKHHVLGVETEYKSGL